MVCEDSSSVDRVCVSVDPLPMVPTAEKPPDEDKKPRTILFIKCCLGLVIFSSINNVVLEQVTSLQTSHLSEWTLTFILSVMYAILARLAATCRESQATTSAAVPTKYFILIALSAFISTVTSMVALRYVCFITRIIGKSCKSIPIMVMGLLFGKRYPASKYISVVGLSAGVAIFLTSSYNRDDHTSPQKTQIVWGSLLLLISLVFDGITGALEDKYIALYQIPSLELMYQLNRFKAVFALLGMVWTRQWTALGSIQDQAFLLVLLSFTGALAQMCIFEIIQHFGALTLSIVGTCRKVLSICLSIVVFGHMMQKSQVAGVVLVLVSLSWSTFWSWRKKKTIRDHDHVELLSAAVPPVEIIEKEKQQFSKDQLVHLQRVEEWHVAQVVVTTAA